MKPTEAQKAAEKIKQICKEYGLYFDEARSNKPELVMIEIGVKIKVDK